MSGFLVFGADMTALGHKGQCSLNWLELRPSRAALACRRAARPAMPFECLAERKLEVPCVA